MEPVDISKEGGLHRVSVNADMTIQNAMELKGSLLGTLEGASAVEIDLSGVEEMDTSGIQLLIMLKREAGARGMSLRVSAFSPNARSASDLYRVTGFLQGAMEA